MDIRAIDQNFTEIMLSDTIFFDDDSDELIPCIFDETQGEYGDILPCVTIKYIDFLGKNIATTKINFKGSKYSIISSSKFSDDLLKLDLKIIL